MDSAQFSKHYTMILHMSELSVLVYYWEQWCKDWQQQEYFLQLCMDGQTDRLQIIQSLYCSCPDILVWKYLHYRLKLINWYKLALKLIKSYKKFTYENKSVLLQAFVCPHDAYLTINYSWQFQHFLSCSMHRWHICNVLLVMQFYKNVHWTRTCTHRHQGWGVLIITLQTLS